MSVLTTGLRSSWGFLGCSLVVGYALVAVITRAVLLSSKYVSGGKQVYRAYLPGLQPGWLQGWQMDLSDHQWRSFREGLPSLAGVLAIFVLLSHTVQRRAPNQRQGYHLLFGLGLIGYLHQSSAAFLLALLLANYALARRACGSRAGPWLVWGFNCAALLAAKSWDGFRFGSLGSSIAFLDHHRGPLRWHIHYNLAVLRCISFAVDLHWRRTQQRIRTTLVEHGKRMINKLRETSLPSEQHYGLRAYLAYVLYPPLYIAGPILTFNAYAAQTLACRSDTQPSAKAVAVYAARWLGAWLLLEAMTQVVYANAIAKSRAWQTGFTAQDIGVTGFWVLCFMWLKFLVIWRFFRLAAMAEGLTVPENMQRCICNNYDIEGFWKNWHASYNAWLVRYMYIPLGGSQWRLLNIWPIFSFVALWHDLEWHLLGWAWLTCTFFAPELAVKWVMRQPAMASVRQSWYYSSLCAAAAAINIGVLMAVNLTGFVVGADGILPFLRMALSDVTFCLSAFIVFFAAAHIMFFLRGWD